jgi:uncharacterized protein
VPLLSIHCFASETTIGSRLAQRAEKCKDISDGRWEIYVKQKPVQEPLTEFPSADCLELNTEAPLEQIALACEKFLRSRVEAVQGWRDGKTSPAVS